MQFAGAEVSKEVTQILRPAKNAGLWMTESLGKKKNAPGFGRGSKLSRMGGALGQRPA